MSETHYTSNLKPIFVCVIAVWGESYTRLFLDIALPAQLTKGNLGALDKSSIFHIYTTEEDAKVIRQSPVFLKLTEIMIVEFYMITDPIENRYHTMSHCHKLAINYANKIHAALIFLTPDCVIADGALMQVQRLLQEGFRVISTVGLRLKKEPVIEHLNQYLNEEKTVLTITSRKLMQLAVNNLHPITIKHIWGGSEEMIPNNLFWRVKDEGLLGRCFHLHPLMVYPRKGDTEFLSTIDFDFPYAACPDLRDHYVVTDSDEIFICELTSELRDMKGVKNGSLKELIQFSESQVYPIHRYNASKYIHLHVGIKTSELWSQIAVESQQTMHIVFQALDLPMRKLLFTNPRLLMQRLIRLGQEAKIFESRFSLKTKLCIIAAEVAKLSLNLIDRLIHYLVAIKYRYLIRNKPSLG